MGESFNFTCNAHGYPIPTFQWIHDGKVISTSSVLKMNNIDSIQKGLYTCNVQSGIFTKTQNTQVNIGGKLQNCTVNI